MWVDVVWKPVEKHRSMVEGVVVEVGDLCLSSALIEQNGTAAQTSVDDVIWFYGVKVRKGACYVLSNRYELVLVDDGTHVLKNHRHPLKEGDHLGSNEATNQSYDILVLNLANGVHVVLKVDVCNLSLGDESCCDHLTLVRRLLYGGQISAVSGLSKFDVSIFGLGQLPLERLGKWMDLE